MSSNGHPAAAQERLETVQQAASRRQPSRRSIWFWISAWLPVAIGIGVIAMESTPAFGADHTSGPLRMIFQAIFGRVSDARWDLIHYYVRKTGHFIGYGCIGLVWLRAWRMTLPRLRYFSDALLAVVGTAMLATWDEWHQSFLPNRVSSPWDVLIDCSGAACLLLVTFFYVRLFRPERLTQM